MRRLFYWLVRTLFVSIVVGLTVAVLTPEVRCCLTLGKCDRCIAVEQLPADWRAKPILVINPCGKNLHMKVRYLDANGESRTSPWQVISAKSEARLKGDDGRQLVSYGGNYAFKAYLASPQERERSRQHRWNLGMSIYLMS